MSQSSEGTISPARSRRVSACSAWERVSRRASSVSGGSEGGSGLGMKAAIASPATVLLRVSPTVLAIRSPSGRILYYPVEKVKYAFLSGAHFIQIDRKS